MTGASIIVHGGAGGMRGMTPAREEAYRAGLRAAADAGRTVLEGGGSALDAAIAAVVTMEDGGVFNAGLGACLTSAGTVELDAAVMQGCDRAFGAVASVAAVANPVLLARAVFERTPHCLLVGEGAAAFARDEGFPLRDDFPPSERRGEWERKAAELRARMERKPLAQALASLGGVLGEQEDGGDDDHDTVGAVARDATGSVAAAVSTGGIWLKRPGRVGDSPLPGAGLWAVDGQGAAVATGTGEYLLRLLVCREVTDGIARHGDATRACADAVALLTERFGSDLGGLVAVAPDGGVGFALNTTGMGRAAWRSGMPRPAVAVWPDEPWDEPGLAGT